MRHPDRTSDTVPTEHPVRPAGDDTVQVMLAGAPDLMTTEEVAALLKVSTSTVIGWSQHAGLTALRIGTRVHRFRREDVHDFLVNTASQEQAR